MAKWHERKDLKPADHMIIAADKIRRVSHGNRFMFVMNILMFIAILFLIFGVKK